MVFRSMYQCEIQTQQVSGQEPDFSKMTNLAGEWLLLVFLNNQTTGTGVPLGIADGALDRHIPDGRF